MPDQLSNPDFEALLKHSQWVRALAHALIKDPDGAEDVVQNTWLAVARNPPKRIGNPRAWLSRVVRNIVGSHWREQKVRRRHDDLNTEIKGMEEIQSSEFGQPDFIVNRLDAARKIVDGLARLPDPYK